MKKCKGWYSEIWDLSAVCKIKRTHTQKERDREGETYQPIEHIFLLLSSSVLHSVRVVAVNGMIEGLFINQNTLYLLD